MVQQTITDGSNLTSRHLDHVLQPAWERSCKAHSQPTTRSDNVANKTPSLVRQLWTLRQQLRQRQPSTKASMFQQWITAVRLAKVTKQIRQAHRKRKQDILDQVLTTASVFRAARRLAPNQPRRRMQLRDQDGRLQTYEGEFDQIVNCYSQLYEGPILPCETLSTPIIFTCEAMQHALHNLAPRKVLPPEFAPAVLWRTAAPNPFVVHRFHGTLSLAEEYQSSTITMLCEIGLRTDAAAKAWMTLDRLCHNATWLPAGCYLRHERMQRSALANRISQAMSKMPEHQQY